MIISFSGPDGSGKTTIMKNSKRFIKETDCRVRNEFDLLLLNYCKKLLKSSKVSVVDVKKRVFFKNLYPFVIYIDYLLLFFYYEILFKDKVLLIDRYVYDYVITFKMLDIKNPLVYFLFNSFPRSYLNFYINVDCDILISRIRKRANEREEGFCYVSNYYKKIYAEYEKFFSFIDCVMVNNKNLNTATQEVFDFINIKKKLLNLRVVSFSGLDGSGKSTTVLLFKKYLKNMNLNCKVCHFYYNYTLLKLANFLFKEKETATNVKYEKSIENEILSRNRKSIFWSFFVILDSYIQYLFIKVFYSKRVIIFDRYFYDYVISFNYLGFKNPDWFLRFVDFPKFSFLQIADPQVLYLRKPEHTLSFFRKEYKSYMDFAKKNRLFIIDSTNKSESNILKDVINIFYDKL